MYRTTASLFGACVAVLSLQANCYAASVTNRLRAPVTAQNRSGASSSMGANTVCINGTCRSCNGAIACAGDHCTCDGDPMGAAPTYKGGGSAPTYKGGPCGTQAVVTHPNGGGSVATSASVDPAAYVSADSAICGTVSVSGPTRVINGSVLNGTARILGRSIIDASVVNEASTVSNSSVVRSTVNDGAKITNSEIENSLLNGAANADRSRIMDSVLQGGVSVVGRTLSGAVLVD
jgi:hypothetical protein